MAIYILPRQKGHNHIIKQEICAKTRLSWKCLDCLLLKVIPIISFWWIKATSLFETSNTPVSPGGQGNRV